MSETRALIRRSTATALIGIVLLPALVSACSSGPEPAEYRFGQPWTHYLYLPQDYTPEQRWPLFIGVNGTSADGRACFRTWQPYADEHGFVLLCPELADQDGQLEQRRGTTRLLDILGRVYEENALQPQIFLAGFSAGAQFVHGYAFTNPTYLMGVSVIATGNYYNPPATSRHIPFVVIVGDQDDPGNIDNSSALAQLLGQSGYSVGLHLLEGEGHTISQAAIDVTLDLFDRTVVNE